MTKEQFWQWFRNNKSDCEKFISDQVRDYSIYETLSDKLKAYSEYLIPELTMTSDNRFVLVISCDGIKKGIDFAERLTKDVGEIDNWIIQSFRQPGPMEMIPVNSLVLKRADIFLQSFKLPSGLYQITFFVKNYSPDNPNYEIGTLLHLDHTIGEYNSMTRIEGVTMNKLGWFQSKKNLKTLDEFKIELDNDGIEKIVS